MATMTQEQRDAAYMEKFGTRHPTQATVLAFARVLFPDRKDIKLRHGMLRLTRGLKTQHLKRWSLLDGDKVLGVGNDMVEAVVAADVEQKRLLAAKAAEEKLKEQNASPAQ